MDGNTIKDIRNLFRLKKENEAIKDKISGDIRSLFELENEEQDYDKTVRVGNWTDNYTACKCNRDRNKNLSIREYLHEIKPCLKDINYL